MPGTSVRRTGLGLLLISGMLMAQSGRIVRSEPLPPSVKDWSLGGLVWNGTNGVMARNSPSPQVVRVNESLGLTSVREVGGFPGAIHITVMNIAITPNGDIAYFGGAQDGERGGAFLSFQEANQTAAPTFIKTYPFAPWALTPSPDGGFLVLMGQVTDPHGEDYGAVRSLDAKGRLKGTLLTAKQLKLPPGVPSVGSYGSSNPAIAAAGSFMYLYIPRLNTIQQWTLKSDFVRSIPVALPDGSKPSGVGGLGLFVTNTQRIALTAYQRIPEDPVRLRHRVIFTDDGERWHDLLPEERQNSVVRGSSGAELVVQVGDRLFWVR